MSKTILTRSERKAAQFIHAGEVVAFPTETVYGLGADLYREDAVHKIFVAKRRPADNPLIAHIADLSELDRVARKIPRAAERLIETFFPGPLTVVLPKAKEVPAIATAGLDTVGVRMPRHAVAQTFLHECGTALAAPSANLSGRPSPTTWQAVKADLEHRISCILKGDRTEIGLESTVVDCSGSFPVVLRAGAISFEQLKEVSPATRLSSNENASLKRSPGTKHKHYSPQARVILLTHPDEAPQMERTAYIGLDEPHTAVFQFRCVCADVEEYAHELFNYFRLCDRENIKTIYCQRVDSTGLGLALMDRIKRAAKI